MSKYEIIFAKGYTPYSSEEGFVIKKVKNNVPWTLLLMILMVKKSLELFTKKNCKKQIKKSFELKKLQSKKEINYI